MAFKFEKLPQLKDVRKTIPKHPTKVYSKRALSAITKVALHHSATTTGSAEAYARYHSQTLGWPSIGYHFVVEQDGTIKWCLDPTIKSYHVGNSNGFALGVCLTGNFATSQKPTKKQWQSWLDLADALLTDSQFKLEADDIWGHQEFPGYSWKPCPSLPMNDVRKEVATFVKEESKPSVKAPATKNESSKNPDYYTIQEGDTFWGIAHNHDGLTVEELIKLNPTIDYKALTVGTQVRIKKDVAVKPKESATTPSTYVIKKGDTFWDIAKAYNTSVDELIKLNPKVNYKALQVGTKINLKATYTAPVKKTTTPKFTLPNGILKRGDKGAAVRQLQTVLNEVYFKVGNVDGSFGPKTEDAVKRFQSMYYGIKSDGIYGPNTKAMLIEKLKELGKY